MDTISKDRAIKILNRKRVNIFTVNDARKIFNVRNENTLYKLLQRLEKADIIKRIISGKYLFSYSDISDFQLANSLISPSYISLESALSFYGILSQFPYTVTSVTINKSRRIVYENKEYEYTHLKSKYFFGFIRKDNLLIASPEKALIDELYLYSKKLRNISLDELDLSKINKLKFMTLTSEYNFLPLKKIIKKYVR